VKIKKKYPALKSFIMGLNGWRKFQVQIIIKVIHMAPGVKKCLSQ